MQISEEHLSALIDDEQGVLGAPDLTQVANSQSASDAWARYHLIGDTLRDRDITPVSTQFSRKLSELLESEPNYEETATAIPNSSAGGQKRTWLSLAIAASVALIAVLGVQQMTPQPGTNNPTVASETPVTAPIASQETVASVADSTATAASFVAPVTQGAIQPQRRLNSYLVKFNEQRSSLGVPSLNPYVRLVGFESH